MDKGGRPTEYKPEYDEQVYKLCLLGATDAQIADFFGVSEVTINAWKHKHEGFLKSLKQGKEIADMEIAESLYHRAKGYTHPEEKIFCNNGEVVRAETTKHYPPDPTSIAYWLNNRQRNSGKWTQRQELAVEGEMIHKVEVEFVNPQNEGSEGI